MKDDKFYLTLRCCCRNMQHESTSLASVLKALFTLYNDSLYATCATTRQAVSNPAFGGWRWSWAPCENLCHDVELL